MRAYGTKGKHYGQFKNKAFPHGRRCAICREMACRSHGYNHKRNRVRGAYKILALYV